MPPMITWRGLLWFVEFDDSSTRPGKHVYVRAWSFRSAFQKAMPHAPKRDPQYRQVGIQQMRIVTPMTLRYWDAR
jgi:hypothetical protein